MKQQYVLQVKFNKRLCEFYPDEDHSGSPLITTGVKVACLEPIPRASIQKDPFLSWRFTPLFLEEESNIMKNVLSLTLMLTINHTIH